MKENDPVDRKQLLILLSAIFLISFSLIGFEIALSRFLSVLLSYHYVFVVLSLALLGLGMGGMLVHFFRPRIPVNEHRFKVLAFLALLFSLAVSFSILAALHVGSVSNYHMDILFYGFVLLIPFLLAGMLLAEIYRIFPAISARIYGADLIGAAAGALGAIVFLNILGGMRTHFVLGVIGSLAAVLFSTVTPPCFKYFRIRG